MPMRWSSKTSLVVSMATVMVDATCVGNEPALGACVGNAGNYRFGCAVNMEYMDSDPLYKSNIVKHCTCITPENDWKMAEVYMPDSDGTPGKGTLLLDRAKKYIDLAHSTGMNCINGHVLVWHNQIDHDNIIQSWTLTNAEWKGWLQTYIETLVVSLQTYSVDTYGENFIKRWDVVSEAFEPLAKEVAGRQLMIPGSTDWRDSHWLEVIGEEYLELAFQWASDATQKAPGEPSSLTYLDYDIEQVNDKSDFVLNKVDTLIHDGVPIDGVGFQAHVTTNIDVSDLHNNFQRFQNNPNIKELAISELDVRGYADLIFESPGILPSHPLFDGDCEGFGSIYFQEQATAYATIARAFLMFDKFQYFTTWGITDKYSWINNLPGGNCNALPLSADYRQKPAFCALVKAFDSSASPVCEGWPLANCGDGICSGDEICEGGVSYLSPEDRVNPKTGNRWVECDDCSGEEMCFFRSCKSLYCCSGGGCTGGGSLCPNLGVLPLDQCPLGQPF